MQLFFELELMVDSKEIEELDEADEATYLYHAIEDRLWLRYGHCHLFIEVKQDQE